MLAVAMSVDERILRNVDWPLRSPEFTTLLLHDEGGEREAPAMTFQPVAAYRSSAWETTRSVWLDLAPHPNLLEALEVRGRGVILRYAALNWRHGRTFGLDGSQHLATIGIQLADALAAATVDLPDYRLGWLTNPFVKIDISGQARIGFLSATPEIVPTTRHMAPELRAFWPACDERALVYLVGAVLDEMCDLTPAQPIAQVIQGARNHDPGRRHRSLAALRDDLASVGGDAGSIRRDTRLAAWNAAEAGIALRIMNDPVRAGALFERALELDGGCCLARWGRDELHSAMGLPSISAAFPRVARAKHHWTILEARARELESERAFADALAVYEDIQAESAPAGALSLAIARCRLALGHTGHAIDFARRAQRAAPDNAEAIELEVRALLVRGEAEAAMERAEALLAISPDHDDARYLRARALLALRRLVEARDAFDDVLVRCPTMIAAMLLRREADRLMQRVRMAAGVQESGLVRDDHLAAVRTMLIEGRAPEAIEELAKPVYAEDTLARLVLAQSLLAAARPEEALAVYVRVAQLGGDHREGAVVGTALALLSLGRSDEAVEMFGQACNSWPNNLDALEGYAHALEAQGRGEEAEAAHRRASAARAARSDLRLRTQTSRR
jgi:tetratricopeptide (TPR) repeat protein